MKKEIEENKKYNKFILLNRLLSFSFSLFILIIYFSFVLIIGFNPKLLSIFLGETYITTGIIIGLSIIILSILLTLVYTIISNTYLDKLKDDLEKWFFFIS